MAEPENYGVVDLGDGYTARQLWDNNADCSELERTARRCGPFVKSLFKMRGLFAEYPKGHCWIARDSQGAPVGFAVAAALIRRPEVRLDEFGVVPEVRGQGLGRRLLTVVSRGKPLRLVVDEENTGAVLFYLRCGLELTYPEPIPNKHGGNVWRMGGAVR